MQVVVNLAQHDAQFGEISLFVALVQVLPEGFGYTAFPLLHGLRQGTQRPLTELQAQCLTATEKHSLSLYNRLYLLLGGILYIHFFLPVKLSIA